MSTTVATVYADLLDRIRDPHGTMLSQLAPPTVADGQAQGFKLIGYAQTYINLAERLAPTTQVITPVANTVLYRLSTSLIPACIRILSCSTSTNELDGGCDFKAFSRNSFTWLTDTGTQFLAYAQIGLDMLALVPCFAASPPNVTVRSLNSLPLPTLGSTTMVVPDDTVEHVTRLAELFARIQSRQLDGFADRLKSLRQAIELSAGTVDGGGKAL